uniref:RT_RNaseH domain-containing protein n=1 Tax=Trichuris muris TaxID=70415 RepID=A0A5S6QP78_TRIMR
MAPLYDLLEETALKRWGSEPDTSFSRIKTSVSSSLCPAHYVPERPLVITCDASFVGIGAILSHVNSDGTEQPIYFASRRLHLSERNYAQTAREDLAIVFAMHHKFRCFVLDRKFTVYTDHKPLLGLLQQGKPIKDCMSPRMMPWSLFLSNCDYELRYRRGKLMAPADVLSRMPLDEDSGRVEPFPP